jgi:dihydroorotate dehydrogenase (fumarate)/dihydroorotate dehydrogenase
MSFYTRYIRPLLFRIDAEHMHNLTIRMMQLAGKAALIRTFLRSIYAYRHPALECMVAGMKFSNPLGIAAGWDKSGHAIAVAESLGFGFYEIGSVSAASSSGNPRPRLFRLPQDQAVVVHYGLQNDGAEVVAHRIYCSRTIPLGVNIVKTNRGMDAKPDSDEAIFEDYLLSTRILKDHPDYLVYNLSCPNTEMGRDFFRERGNLRLLLELLRKEHIHCPVFLKISPLGGVKTLEQVLEEVEGIQFVTGFMLNLPPGKRVPLRTPSHVWREMPGAIAGKPVEHIINKQLGELYRRMDRKKYQVIAAGGVFTAQDAYRKIRLGASAVQILTALIYEGPTVVARINRGLCKLLFRDGFHNVQEAVGVDIA